MYSPYCAVSVFNIREPQKHWNENRSYSLQTAYLIFEAHFKFFFQQFPWVLQLWMFFIRWYQKEWSLKLRIVNGGWHETLNLLHISRFEMLHCVTSYMKQNKSRKQTLESAQNGLEISFNTICKVTYAKHRKSVTSRSMDHDGRTPNDKMERVTDFK